MSVYLCEVSLGGVVDALETVSVKLLGWLTHTGHMKPSLLNLSARAKPSAKLDKRASITKPCATGQE